MTSAPVNNTDTKTVYLERRGHTAAFAPLVPELIPKFQTSWLKFHIKNDALKFYRGGIRLIITDADEMKCSAGLAELVTAELKRMGYRVVDSGRGEHYRLRTIGVPQPINIAPHARLDIGFLRFVSEEERGVVLYDPQHVSLARLISQVAQSYPRLRIVCCVTRIDDAWHLRRQLEKWHQEPIHVIKHGPRIVARARIVIGPYGSLGGGDTDLEHTDFIFALNPTEMLINTCGQLVVRNALKSRIFGFVPTGRRLIDWERDACTQVLGQGQIVIPRHGQVQRKANAVFLPVEGGPALGSSQDICSMQRNGIWRHPVRMRRVARLADAIASGSAESLARLARQAEIVRLVTACGAKPRVCVLVANIEQAIEICGRLKGWKLVSARQWSSAGLSEQDKGIIRLALRQPNRRAKGIIVTQAGLDRLRRCDILIRADGGTGALPLQWANCTQLNINSPPPVLVIDFHDRHHPVLRRRSRERKEAYLNAGLRLPIDYPSDLDHFLATRPRWS